MDKPEVGHVCAEDSWATDNMDNDFAWKGIQPQLKPYTYVKRPDKPELGHADTEDSWDRYCNNVDNYFAGEDVRPHVESLTYVKTPLFTVIKPIKRTTLQEKAIYEVAFLPHTAREVLPPVLQQAVAAIAPFNHSTRPVQEICFVHSRGIETSDDWTTCKQCQGRQRLNKEYQK